MCSIEEVGFLRMCVPLCACVCVCVPEFLYEKTLLLSLL